MKTWTLTIAGSRRFNERTIIGAGRGPRAGPSDCSWAAAQAATIRARRQRRTAAATPRSIGGQLAAIVQTGDDELGRPDHAGAADELLEQLSHTRSPSER